jgi:hypothetical protein
MKKIGFVCLLILPFLGQAQISYEFASPLPPGAESLSAPYASHFGMYKSDRSDIYFELSPLGIYTISTVVGSVSKDSVNDGGKYIVRNNHIFGIHESDSIPVALQGHRYYFGIRHREEVIGPNSKNVLSRVSNQSYLLNFYEDGGYVPCLFSIVEGELGIQYFDYESDTQMFAKVPKKIKKEEEFLTVVSLSPQREDFADINFMEMFNSERKYKKTL